MWVCTVTRLTTMLILRFHIKSTGAVNLQNLHKLTPFFPQQKYFLSRKPNTSDVVSVIAYENLHI